MAERRRVVISGLVQGVWFRDSCWRRAQELGLSGWVRNRADGRVEAVFEGESGSLDTMVDWCHHGPPRARVDHVDLATEPAEGLTGFVVR